MSKSKAQHILFLDDDEATVFLTTRMLKRRGYRVTCFRTQQEAIDAVRVAPAEYDLFLTDLNMPGISGIDVGAEILRINPDLPVALTSGIVTDQLVKRAHAAGIRAVFLKPDSMSVFLKAIEQVLADSPQAEDRGL